MPWSDYPSELRQFSGLIQQAANERFGSASTVQIISQAAKAAGIALGFNAYTAISSMYGRYVQVRETTQLLSAALTTTQLSGRDQAITADMISQPPWAPDARSWSLNPYVLVTGTYSMEGPEGPVTGFFSHQYHVGELGTVGQTLADLQAQIDQSSGGTNLQGATVDGLTSITWSPP